MEYFLFAFWFLMIIVLVAVMIYLLIQHCNYGNHQSVLAFDGTNNVTISSTYQDGENDGFEMQSL